jgi:ABC-type polysaccharide/polyol phosphate export permease
MMIQQTVVMATASIVNNQALIRKVYIPKIVFPLSNILARFVDHIIMALLLLGFMAIYRVPFTWNLLFVFVVLCLHFFFSLGLSLISATAYIKIRDVQNIIAIIFQALFFATPIIYSLNILPENYRPYFLWNPFYYFVQCFRYPVYNASLPPKQDFLIALVLTVIVFFAGIIIFHKKEKLFVFHLS